MAMPSDTEAWADKKQIEILRKLGPGKRLELAMQMSSALWNASRANVERLYPDWTEDQRDFLFLSSLYGKQLAQDFMAWRARKKSQ